MFMFTWQNNDNYILAKVPLSEGMIRLFLKEIRYRWVVHLLTIIIVACVMSILVIQTSLNTSAENRINELSHKLGQNMLVIPEGTDLESFYLMKYGELTMAEDVGDRVKMSSLGKHVELVDPRLYGNIKIRGEDALLIGQRMDLANMGLSGDRFAVVGAGIAKRMGITTNQYITIGNESLYVLMVADPPPKGMDMAVFVPLGTAQRILKKPGRINALYMGGCWCELDIAGFAKEVEKMIPGVMAITIDGMAKAQTGIVAVMERYTVVLWIVCAVLAIGSIVFLILYTVKKSEREIGLLLSIGLAPGFIVMKNLLVGLLTGAAGALSGFLLSLPFMSYLGDRFLRLHLAPAWELLPVFIGGACLVALFASSIPSWYAARLDPAILLREE